MKALYPNTVLTKVGKNNLKKWKTKVEKLQLPFAFEKGLGGNSEVDSDVCRFTLDESFFIAKITKK